MLSSCGLDALYEVMIAEHQMKELEDGSAFPRRG